MYTYNIAANFHASNQSEVQPIFTDKTQGGTGKYYLVIGKRVGGCKSKIHKKN